MIFQLSDGFPKPIIWAIIVKFDQIRKNWWRIYCSEIFEVGKKFFAASSVKKISRFAEVSPEISSELLENKRGRTTSDVKKVKQNLMKRFGPRPSSVILFVGVLVFGFWFHLSSFVNYFYSVVLCDSAFFAFLISSLSSIN